MELMQLYRSASGTSSSSTGISVGCIRVFVVQVGDLRAPSSTLPFSASPLSSVRLRHRNSLVTASSLAAAGKTRNHDALRNASHKRVREAERRLRQDAYGRNRAGMAMALAT